MSTPPPLFSLPLTFRPTTFPPVSPSYPLNMFGHVGYPFYPRCGGKWRPDRPQRQPCGSFGGQGTLRARGLRHRPLQGKQCFSFPAALSFKERDLIGERFNSNSAATCRNFSFASELAADSPIVSCLLFQNVVRTCRLRHQSRDKNRDRSTAQFNERDVIG